MKRTLGQRLLLVCLVWLTVVIPVVFAEGVRTGIDVLITNNCRQLASKRIELITNHSGFDQTGRRTTDLLASAPGVKLVAIFARNMESRAMREQSRRTRPTAKMF